MKKFFSIWVILTVILLSACGKAEEVPAPEGNGIQESVSAKESNISPDSEGNENGESTGKESTDKESGEEEPAVTYVPMPKEPVYISQEFLDLLTRYLMGEIGEEALEEIVMDTELSDEELEAYASDPVVAEYLQFVENVWRGWLFLRVDGDNDGIEDLFAWIYDGGSMGNNSRHFLKGQEDGSFQFTCRTEACTQEIAFVRYGETTYLMETDFDYDLKSVNGFVVTLYQDGEVLETLTLTKEIDGYEPEIVYQAAGYEETASRYAEEGRSGFYITHSWGSRDWDIRTGTAETEIEWGDAQAALDLTGSNFYVSPVYRSDLNNDGEQEWYGKNIFYPSNIYTYLSLEDALYEEGVGAEKNAEGRSVLYTYGLEWEGVPVFFWVDGIDGKQILFLLSYDGIDREILYGYLIEEDESAVVLKIDYIGIPVMKYSIYTQGINYVRDPWAPYG